MNALVAAKVFGDGFAGDVLQRNACLCKRGFVGPKRPEVARKNANAVPYKKSRHSNEELHMVALHVKGAPSHAT